jgi:predicted metal-dependent hydrolase
MSPHDLRPETRNALARGRVLYLAGRYFEAHEAWEEAWRVETGPVRSLLQGLIQVAAGFVKAVRDARPAGTVKLFESAAERLSPFPEVFAGLALGRFRADLAAATEAARRWRDGSARKFVAGAPRLDLVP